MNIIQEFFSGIWAQALGWTLLHSLWQVMLICGLVALLLRVSAASSQWRYFYACGGLLLACLISLSTFVYTYRQLQPDDVELQSQPMGFFLFLDPQTSADFSIASVLHFFDANMFSILIVWISGLVIFSLRLLGSWWYVNRLKNNSMHAPHQWSETLGLLALRMGIKKTTFLAESSRVTAPIVIGYLKPVILVPVGMFSGLTTEEIETIFLHELAHIKRHDYLVNLLQSVIEVLFFFNPFVWILSGLIRREREYCCDDLVVRYHGNALAYAYALTRLEETRLTATTLALSLGNNKNQLLYRIKRMMEKSFKPQKSRERILPVMLVTVGLICASWLSMKTDDGTLAHSTSSDEQDTVIKKSDKSASYSRRTVTTIDENGQPREVTVVEIEGDKSLLPKTIPAPPLPVDLKISDIQVPPVPDMKDFEDITHRFMRLDTIPGRFRFEAREWEIFNENFRKRFNESFDDFYKEHEREYEHMMQELTEQLNSEQWSELREQAFRQAEQAMEALEVTQALEPNKVWKAHEAALLAKAEAMREVAEWQREHADDMREWAEKMETWQEAHREQFKELEKNFHGIEQRTKDFQKDLKKMLIKDGYLKENEELKHMHWNLNGDIEINGKKIKESDNKKYQ